LRRDFSAAAHRVRRNADVLIIGAGGGRDIRIALMHGQRHVRAVEVNPLVVRMANETFGDFTGHVYDEKKVQKVVGDARSYIANSEERFGIILASLIDTWAASAAGAFALTENLLYTTDAFRDYYEHLTEDGLLSVSRWHPLETPRLLATGLEAWSEMGAPRLLATGLEAWSEMGASDPRRHAVILIRKSARFQPVVTLLMKRSPFEAEEIRTLEGFAADTGMKVALTPESVDDPVIGEFLATGESPWPRIDVEPVSDDRPFFFNMVKPLDQVESALGLEAPVSLMWFDANFEATEMLVRLFVGVMLLVAFTTLTPLLLGAGAVRGSDSLSVLIYFCGLGLGYILIEVGLLQRLILLLGKPVYALAVILGTMLLASGLGSLASGGSASGANVRGVDRGDGPAPALRVLSPRSDPRAPGDSLRRPPRRRRSHRRAAGVPARDALPLGHPVPGGSGKRRHGAVGLGRQRGHVGDGLGGRDHPGDPVRLYDGLPGRNRLLPGGRPRAAALGRPAGPRRSLSRAPCRAGLARRATSISASARRSSSARSSRHWCSCSPRS
jgi:hypothetical protein